MKRFLSFIHKALFLLAVATISVAFEGCSEVADKTMDGIKDLPAQIIRMATPEIAETVGSEKNMTPETTTYTSGTIISGSRINSSATR